MDVEIIKAGIYALTLELPLILVYLVGVAISFSKAKEQKNNSLLIIIIFCSALLISVATILFNAYIPYLMYTEEQDVQKTIIIIGGVNLFLSLLMAIVWGLIVYLIFFRTSAKAK